jgi:hypothetical protein
MIIKRRVFYSAYSRNPRFIENFLIFRVEAKVFWSKLDCLLINAAQKNTIRFNFDTVANQLACMPDKFAYDRKSHQQ